MALHAGDYRLERGLTASIAGHVVPFVIVAAASVAMALSVWLLGMWALAVPIYAGTAVLAIAYPRPALIGIGSVLVAADHASFGFTEPLSILVYEGPPEQMAQLPLTIWPIEIALLVALGSLVLRGGLRRAGPPLPLLVWAVPVVVALGMAYGFYQGAESQFVYHEARGLIFGTIAFAMAASLDERYRRIAFLAFLAGSTVLASIVIIRYLAYVRWGELPVPMEFAFAHESTIFLTMGLIISAILILRGEQGWSRLGLLLLMLLYVAALAATGRRAGTLVGLVGVSSILIFVFPRRPLLIAGLSLLLLMGSGAYLGAYWNKEYGALAQPARAIRSQFQPSERDDSSDLYRSTEKYNLLQTIRGNRIFGVGFGQEFGRFQELPDLTAFWPMQFHTPHQNILWLWLKMGIAGIITCLAVFVLAMRRCLSAIHHHEMSMQEWVAAAVIAASLLMFLAFATVDIVFPGSRGMVILGILFALAFNLRERPPVTEARN